MGAFSPNDEWLLVAGSPAYLVNTQTGEIEPIPAWGGWVYGGTFSAGGHLLALATNDGVQVWNVTAKPQLVGKAQDNTSEVRSVTLSPNGKLLAAGDQAGGLYAWNVSPQGKVSGKRTVASFEAPVRTVAFSPNNQVLAAGSYDHTVQLWNTSSFQFIRQFSPNGQAVTSVAFSPDSLILATTSGDGAVRLWNAVTGDLLLLIPADNNKVGVQFITFGTQPGTLEGTAGIPQMWKLPQFPALSETPQQQVQRVLQELS